MKTRTNRPYWLRLINLSLILIILVNPVSTRAAFASGVYQPVPAQKTVTASAVIVPAQVSELAFLISGIAKEVPVKEGDLVKAGQPLMVLDTPDLEFAFT